MKTVLVLAVACVALAHAGTLPQTRPRPRQQARTFPLEKAPLRRWSKEELVIDGKNTNIGLASAYFLNGMLDDTWGILGKIAGILLGSGQGSDDVDYFEVIREQVQQVVGDYIDAHNMDQLEIYKSSLGILLDRYNGAPEESETYPDKNTVANSLSTSIISNRFLVEAGERPQSMIIHFADIASVHILVLKDAAETYTTFGSVSQWWRDLDDQLAHYIAHGMALQNEVVDWRNDMMTCDFDEGGKYDEWTVNDPVNGVTDTCKQLHGTHNCDDHCQAYQVAMNREVSAFVWHYMGRALMEWEVLKLLSSQMSKLVPMA